MRTLRCVLTHTTRSRQMHNNQTPHDTANEMNTETAASKKPLETKEANTVTPDKKRRRIDEDGSDAKISSDTVLGFPSHPTSTNMELITKHHGFVEWAKKKDADEGAFGRLKDFLDWLHSPEGKHLEEGCERFTFGSHKGKTFLNVANADPKYHTRYVYMLKKDDLEPSGQLARYIDWFKKAKKLKIILGDDRWCGGTEEHHDTEQVEGTERFDFGLHKGQTFSQVTENDPSYHLRFRAVNPSLNDTMKRYIQYFNAHGDHRAAHEGEMDCLAQHAGIIRPGWW